MLEQYFKLRENGTTVKTEVLAGLTTFLTMAYIIFVNPAILAKAGIDPGAAFVATCLAAAIGTAIMGLYANYPVALAPGMGLNAYFAFGVVLGMGHSWQVALGAVFLSGVIFLIISVLPIREAIINSIPHSQKLAIGAGIGLFLGLIGLKEAGLVVDHPATLVTLGKVAAPTVLMAIVGFLLIAILDYRRLPGAIIIGILVVTVLGIALGLSKFGGIVSAPPSLAADADADGYQGCAVARPARHRLRLPDGRPVRHRRHAGGGGAARRPDGRGWQAQASGQSAGG